MNIPLSPARLSLSQSNNGVLHEKTNRPSTLKYLKAPATVASSYPITGSIARPPTPFPKSRAVLVPRAGGPKATSFRSAFGAATGRGRGAGLASVHGPSQPKGHGAPFSPSSNPAATPSAFILFPASPTQSLLGATVPCAPVVTLTSASACTSNSVPFPTSLPPEHGRCKTDPGPVPQARSTALREPTDCIVIDTAHSMPTDVPIQPVMRLIPARRQSMSDIPDAQFLALGRSLAPSTSLSPTFPEMGAPPGTVCIPPTSRSSNDSRMDVDPVFGSGLARPLMTPRSLSFDEAVLPSSSSRASKRKLLPHASGRKSAKRSRSTSAADGDTELQKMVRPRPRVRSTRLRPASTSGAGKDKRNADTNSTEVTQPKKAQAKKTKRQVAEERWLKTLCMSVAYAARLSQDFQKRNADASRAPVWEQDRRLVERIGQKFGWDAMVWDQQDRDGDGDVDMTGPEDEGRDGDDDDVAALFLRGQTTVPLPRLVASLVFRHREGAASRRKGSHVVNQRVQERMLLEEGWAGAVAEIAARAKQRKPWIPAKRSPLGLTVVSAQAQVENERWLTLIARSIAFGLCYWTRGGRSRSAAWVVLRTQDKKLLAHIEHELGRQVTSDVWGADTDELLDDEYMADMLEMTPGTWDLDRLVAEMLLQRPERMALQKKRAGGARFAERAAERARTGMMREVEAEARRGRGRGMLWTPARRSPLGMMVVTVEEEKEDDPMVVDG
ncbi:hypothetical protein PUNSTDRAFT_45481 [Punctularia strigosozonata HHB-11173 SS5]|uniref:uncharacterized protein n=1 Tax=Punctularia strigosozonata (strain HHB-11173) TaxID=741275 RepID=UPI00044175E0|nr:uncharacterized protein PUNSTDRAFT_45481 [Punctularia strigosozonata HHB-11173 SS5]EIN08090.1 hypothetical protein PUNSTDRAFT_45481 [Punctularia strigosozonata HHB-11173 SS5]